MTFAREEVADACRRWGAKLWVPAGISGPRLLWAISGCESSFGANCTPRHEPAYDVGGRYAENPDQAKLLELYGSAGACSYGPWQIMLVNCLPGATPEEMAVNVNRCALETIGFINRRILKAQGATKVSEAAISYNSGRWQWREVPAGVERYAEQCEKYYESEPMPDAAVEIANGQTAV